MFNVPVFKITYYNKYCSPPNGKRFGGDAAEKLNLGQKNPLKNVYVFWPPWGGAMGQKNIWAMGIRIFGQTDTTINFISKSRS